MEGLLAELIYSKVTVMISKYTTHGQYVPGEALGMRLK